MSSEFFTRCGCRAARLSAVAFASFMAVVLLAALPARADVYWTLSPSQSGDWSNPANWGGAVPTGTDQAYIVNGGTATITGGSSACRACAGRHGKRNRANDRRKPQSRGRGARGKFRHGDLHAISRNKQSRQYFLSRLQPWQQRHVQSQRNRAAVGRNTVRGLRRQWELHAIRRYQQPCRLRQS